MEPIISFMTREHRHCDDFFSAAEEAVSQGDWDQAGPAWERFCTELLSHLDREEEILFPAFEAKTGQTQGPTAVMRMEHQQMRAMVHDLNRALTEQDEDDFLGLTETLMILMQQHNMKEEQMLYPMSDQVLGGDEALLTRLQEPQPA